jgi:uncharacterized membrane protein YkvA (DUF1232 family)
MPLLARWKEAARRIKQDVYALYLAYRDPRVPWYAKVLVACVVAYAFSPIDLIPDPIPVIGYLDDLVLLPLGIYLAVKMIPPPVMEKYRLKAQQEAEREQPNNWIAAAVILLLWVGIAAALFLYLWNRLGK